MVHGSAVEEVHGSTVKELRVQEEQVVRLEAMLHR
jgi:hypothetical protein